MRSDYSGAQLTALVALRFAIGWHFFYEGVSKAVNAYWTSAGYLDQSQGFLSEWFVNLASNPGTLAVVDLLNVWGLILVGLGLMLGGLTRTATFFGIIMLAIVNGRPEILTLRQMMSHFVDHRREVVVRRTRDRAHVTIHCARPGLVIGRRGVEVDRLKSGLDDLTGRSVDVSIEEVRDAVARLQVM